MTDNHGQEPADDARTMEPDGGTVGGAAQDHRDTDYLRQEVNLLRPSTPFMRDHLKLVWGTFIAWTLVVWGPVTLTYLAPGPMTSTTVLGFPLHYLLVALGAPTGALVLAAVYAGARDRLDEKYGIEHGAADREDAGRGAGATDGGVDR
jgi:putative solute:sodium symporter small subunit